MAEEFAGKGDPLKSLNLLWGRSETGKRGPKSRLAWTDLVAAAIAIADDEGIDSVSTRRVAEAVGISPMSFYTYIPDKAVLIDLMLDMVSGGPDDAPIPEFEPAQWRDNISFIARSLRDFYLAHPWTLQVTTHRPVLGPKTMRAYEAILRAVDGLGLDEVEMDMTVALVTNYVFGAVRDAARASMVKQQTGMSDDEWWYAIAPFLETLDFSAFRVANRVGPIVGELFGLGDPHLAFEFGLARLLDGIAALIDGKQDKPSPGPT
ncbi:MAG: TetR/AcrR family transcriptional regulator C-terminal domain-containing protein [Devosia sp.]|uniref:TetR/AcrR family transcriptional regulator C-terminal domain-containing protein n=1 Tax=Devosia sp. TaxID=1871048 RepID=UPI0024C75F8F|nr:TetR/AcrR family transcriptional regulator C-terminal domain-containing protein [Devosia sp.]UYO00981.1 MAG: TetR/AcrR family transcriptional regulator C-terminal domain-containing protein [Devosia sp.]